MHYAYSCLASRLSFDQGILTEISTDLHVPLNDMTVEILDGDRILANIR